MNMLGKIAKAISTVIGHIALRASSNVAGHIKVSSSPAITEIEEFALDAREKNASIDGTLANQISKLTTNLSNKSKIIVEAVTLTGNGANWILVSNNGRKLIAAQSVRDDTAYYIMGIQKQSTTGLYTLIFSENIGEGAKQPVWLTWLDN